VVATSPRRQQKQAERDKFQVCAKTEKPINQSRWQKQRHSTTEASRAL
jgi:hypothetical protein